MADNQWHIIAYDIKDSKRLAKIHRALQKVAMPLQHSVFLVFYSPTQLEKLLQRLTRLMVMDEDDLRCYPIHDIQHLWLHGRSSHPDLYVNDPAPAQTWNHTQPPAS